MNEKLFKDMTADEQLKYVTDLSKFREEKLPILEQLGDAWEQCHIKSVREGLMLISAFQFARDFVDKALRYGDYSARVYRLRFYVDLIQKKVQNGEGVKGSDGKTYVVIPQMKQKAPRRGRPASAETIARREAEAKAAQQQTEIFAASDTGGIVPAVSSDGKAERITEGLSPSVSPAPQSGQVPFIAPTTRDDLEYKLSIAQKRAFLSPDLQQQADQIRALRTTAGAAAEKAKTMAELKASPELIAPVAEEAQRTLEQVESIYAAIDHELAELWYRLQNDSPEWKEAWLRKHGFIKPNDGGSKLSTLNSQLSTLLHPDLLHDLRKHYKKVTESQPDFDAIMRQRIEQESPEYIEKQKEEAAKKKEVQDIIRYFKRKDKGQKLDTARTKFARLQELLGKKEAANYKPLLTKIEDDARASEKAKKPSAK